MIIRPFIQEGKKKITCNSIVAGNEPKEQIVLIFLRVDRFIFLDERQC